MTQRINREADHFHLVKMIIGTIFLLAMLVLPNMTVCAEGDTVTLSGSGTLTSQFVKNNLGDATEVVISGFSEIGESAFSGCSNLTSVTIPDSVTTIKYRAFRGCSSLTSVTIPDSVTTIGISAFSGCSGLTSVTIPNSVTTMGHSAFEGCSNLKTAGPIGGGYNIEFGWEGLLPTDAFGWGTSLTSVTIPNSITNIGSSVFDRCTSLTSVTIPDSVTIIGTAAFASCSSLTSVTIPNSVTRILSYAFSGCSGLTSVTIPNSVTRIGDETFKNCSSLTNIIIKDSVEFIGDDAFEGCSNVTIWGYPGTKAESYANENRIPFVCIEEEKENDSAEEEKANDSAEEKIENGFVEVDGSSYWYEGGVKQGTYDDPKGVLGDGTVRGREIYDPVSNGWYWLDACYDGAKACNKEVWMPYIYQNEASWDDAEIEMNANNSGSMKQQVIDFIKKRYGKWVRYDANGKMVKGWYTVEGADAELYPEQIGNTYYYDYQTGLMAKGKQVIDGQEYFFDEVTGALQK